MVDKVDEKARRRIRRFIKTGVHQARVHQLFENIFEYKEKHHMKSRFFKLGVDGRLWKKKNSV